MKLVYMGTPDFAVPALEALAKAGHEIKYVVTRPDAVRDRGKKLKFSPVKEKALELGIEVLQPEKIRKNPEFRQALEDAKPDAIVVAAYGQILPKSILEIPKFGCLNIHGSLLPRFRGAAPIQASILAGDEETGITIMFMEKGLDTGDMIAKARTPIDGKTGEQLHDELSMMGAELMVETLGKIEIGDCERVKQDDSLATYAPMISKADGHADFSKEPEDIERMIRAFNAWPGTYAFLNGKTFKLWKAEVIAKGFSGEKDKGPAPSGTILAVGDDGIDIAVGTGALRVSEIQAQGKKRMAVRDYLRGNTLEPGAVFE